MSEFQSNVAAFHRSSHIVLPPYLIYGMEAHTLWCVLYGSFFPFKISVHPDADVEDLKEEIWKKKKVACRDPDASNLVLWKVHFYSRDLCFH